MNRKVFTIMLVVMAMALAVVVPAFAEEQPTTNEELQAEISALRAEIAELKQALAALEESIQAPEETISIGVMPIENADWGIPEVGGSFREVLVSALQEYGVQAVESLDSETLQWVQYQDQLVREGWVDPVSAPPRGELHGVTHYLFGIVIRYQEDQEDLGGIAGALGIDFQGEARLVSGSLVVDFRLIDARTGVALDSFRTEATVRSTEIGVGGYADIIIGEWQRREAPLPEKAARACARQAAERIAGLLSPATTTE